MPDDVVVLPTDPSPPSAVAPGWRAGDRLGDRYCLLAPVGSGGTGTVWRALDETLGVEVALKALRADRAADAHALARFRREVNLARGIVHRNVCRVHDTGTHRDTPFLTMELVNGASVRELVRERTPFAERARLVEELLAGVAAVHRAGVVHRDVKPENVVVAGDGRAVLVDFGLARRLEEGETTAAHAGTPSYMAPEQLRGEPPSTRSDVFACGMVVFEILSGEPAFAGVTPPLVTSAILRDPPRPLAIPGAPPGVTAAVDVALRRALAKDATQRPADAGALWTLLEPALRGRPLARRWRGPAAVLAGASGLAALVWTMWPAGPSTSPVEPRVAVRLSEGAPGDAALRELGAAAASKVRAALAVVPGVAVVDGDAEREATLQVTVGRVGGDARVTLEWRRRDGQLVGPALERHAAAEQAATLLDWAALRATDEARLWSAAEERLRRAALMTRNPTARERLTSLYRRVTPVPQPEQLDAAIALLDETLAADPHYVPALVDTAYLRLRRARRDGDEEQRRAARAAVDRAVALAPRDAPAWAMSCRVRQNEVDGAADPDDVEIEAAHAACDRALSLGSRDAAVQEALGRLHDLRCQDGRAVEMLQRALELDRGRTGRILEHLVGLAIQADRLPLADELSARLVAFAAEEAREGERSVSGRAGIPPIEGAHVMRAAALLRLGDRAGARGELFDELALARPEHADPWAEAAALAGLLRIEAEGGPPAPGGSAARLGAIEAGWSEAVAADPQAAFVPASALVWTDPRRAARWLDRIPAEAASCKQIIWLSWARHAAGDTAAATETLERCRSQKAWARDCVGALRRSFLVGGR